MSKLVLVIDDDPDVWTTLALRLKSFGYNMISAKDGSQGIQKARELMPDLILLDFSLPDESGLDILKKLKSDSSDPIYQIPVVMLTGREEHERACLEAGAESYVTKPFDLFQLKETLAKFLVPRQD
jgi:two-component system alkaline phosphatase synthesis response regulator PhoP